MRKAPSKGTYEKKVKCSWPKEKEEVKTVKEFSEGGNGGQGHMVRDALVSKKSSVTRRRLG